MPVLGVPILERNFVWLLSQGHSDLAIAAAASEDNLHRFIEGRCRSLARAFGARFRLLTEVTPLGTIGASRLLSGAGDLVVINVDNLTTLDLAAMVRQHRAHRAALTIATHVQRLRVPYGEVATRGRKISAVQEKPEWHRPVSSGAYVLSAEARQVMPPTSPMDVPELVRRLQSLAQPVYGFQHQAPWVDINDAEGIHAAENLIASRFEDFECSWSRPSADRVLLMASRGGNLCVAADSSDMAEPGLPLRAGMRPEVLARAHAAGPRRLIRFDHAEEDGRVTRFHLFACDGVEGPATDIPCPSMDTATARILARAAAHYRHAHRTPNINRRPQLLPALVTASHVPAPIAVHERAR